MHRFKDNKCLWLLPVILLAAFSSFVFTQFDSGSSEPPASAGAGGKRVKPESAVTESRATGKSSVVAVFELEPDSRLGVVLGSRSQHETVPARIAALYALGALSEVELRRIYDFLEAKRPGCGLEPAETLWLKNDLMTYLRYRDPSGERHTARLVALFRGRENGEAIRDYALQHLASLGSLGRNSDAVNEVLLEALDEKKNSFAGTALLGINRIREAEYPTLSAEALGPLALQIARDSEYSIASRLSALQVASRSQADAATEYALALLGESQSPPMMLLSAIGHLKHSDLAPPEAFRALCRHRDSRVRRAASLAQAQSLNNKPHQP